MRFPKQSTWEILPGVSSFLNYAECVRARRAVSLQAVSVPLRVCPASGSAWLSRFLSEWITNDRAIGNVQIRDHKRKTAGHLVRIELRSSSMEAVDGRVVVVSSAVGVRNEPKHDDFDIGGFPTIRWELIGSLLYLRLGHCCSLHCLPRRTGLRPALLVDEWSSVDYKDFPISSSATDESKQRSRLPTDMEHLESLHLPMHGPKPQWRGSDHGDRRRPWCPMRRQKKKTRKVNDRTENVKASGTPKSISFLPRFPSVDSTPLLFSTINNRTTCCDCPGNLPPSDPPPSVWSREGL